MLHRKLAQFCAEQRPVWIYLSDQQCWIEQALVVEIEGETVTIRYDEQDDDERQTWEISVRLQAIGAVSTRLARVSMSTAAEDLPTTGDCPEAERLGHS